MTHYKPPHRLLLNYDKVCPSCNTPFYSRSLKRVYCSKPCGKIGYNQKNKEFYLRNKDKIREKYLRNKKKAKI